VNPSLSQSQSPAHHPRHSGWPESIQWFLEIIVISVFIVTFIAQAFQIPSESMENTLLIGDYLLVDKLHFGKADFMGRVLPYDKVQRGDIIVFHYPLDPSVHFVKRVIGIPGDRIRLIDKQVYINGVPMVEPYARYFRPHDSSPDVMFRDDFPRLDHTVDGLNGAWWLEMKKLVDEGQLIVPEGNYFAMGDNRDDSSDSRYWGFVPQENIVGRPLLIYWSVRSPNPEAAAVTPGDKLYRFINAMSHITQTTRWDRTLRVVR
jgi:signal peptidase I